MNVLLLYPEFPDTFWSYKHALKFIRKQASLPPLGLLTVAAMLPRAWEKRLVDLNVRKLRDKDVRWADVVFISAMIVQRESARAVIEETDSPGTAMVAPMLKVAWIVLPDSWIGSAARARARWSVLPLARRK